MHPLTESFVPFRSTTGAIIARLRLTPTKDVQGDVAPLVEIAEADAREHGEATVQLREAERYEYEVECPNGIDLRLRCSLAERRKSLRTNAPDAGLIETRSHCGTLLLELVEGEATSDKTAFASALIEVRSLKLNYRTEYRGMLRRLADELTGLVADARSSAKVGFFSSFEERRDEGWLQIQIELLREVLDSSEFFGALQRILSFPHERLSTAAIVIPTDREVRWTAQAVRQLVSGQPRKIVLESHPLRMMAGLNSVAAKVSISRKARDLDTPENRFVKFALMEFRTFLTHARSVFESGSGWEASSALARRLAVVVDDWLARAYFQEVAEMRILPLGSPVLQRRAGYREVLRAWLRFRTAAEMSWEGGEDLFRAGKRDVAGLYEYWLFFELLDWFCRKCCAGNRPKIEELLDGLDDGSPNLRLKKRTELGPFTGHFAGSSRRLNAQFHYNRRFEVTKDREASGSWTRRLHPDYTFTFWPAGFTQDEAERRELLVHIHFDAKYRVEDIEGLFGTEDSEDVDEDATRGYKRQDLLKMHAYRDAIKRSQGAYILYPGGARAPERFRGFHEILPGLGAFAVTPNEDGAAQGLSHLESFFDEVLSHLCNRTTALERISFHIAESYGMRESAVPYDGLVLAEADIYGNDFTAPPPAEHMVLLGWFENFAQRELAEHNKGMLYVRLGRRSGALHVHPNLARARHCLLRTHGPSVAEGLLQIREPGFRVFTRSQLRGELRAHAKGAGVAAWEAQAALDDDEHIYALFCTRSDPAYIGQGWNATAIMELVEAFESDSRNKQVINLGRTSPYPRILPLKDLLKARTT